MNGTLYVVATPIGNLEDITLRAIRILSEVDIVAAEDTRRSRKLLDHLSIAKQVVSCHKFNESRRASEIIDRLKSGANVALVADAGTPVISDPGIRLVKSAQQAGIRTVPIPGPSALTCALSVCAIDADRFTFSGFLPSRAAARTHSLAELARETKAIVIFEAPHRIVQTLEELACSLGENRNASLCRELTKLHETVICGTLGQLSQKVAHDPESRKGEFVIVIDAAESIETAFSVDDTLRALLQVLPRRTAARTAAKILNKRSNELYRRSLELE